MAKYEKIPAATMRLLVSQAQIDGRCSEDLGTVLVRVHEIVRKMCGYFRHCTQEEIEEATSWSIERWLTRGVRQVDLARYDNPFSYFFRGSKMNMMNRIQQMRKKQRRRERYEQAVRDEMLLQFPSLQNKDLEAYNENNWD